MVKEEEGSPLPGAPTPSQESDWGPGVMHGQLRSQAAEPHIQAPLANSCVTLGKLITLSELLFPHL